ncbi:type II toxin-antitoxin system RelE/ParE family toxin [Nevskia sp.]|uniref:type II toxin-antitoxin system RelE/ParE family toxin n=1 Tax=Nevskia sp. TaxID=1929292 RepID=UPI0025CCA43E|nr:type II toxin-antitoxin system RelE/ParE family toxin [Nevskia sp.]
MRLLVRPEAQAELLDAQRWYEQRSPGLGFEFARAVDAAMTRALRMPLAFPCIEAEFRHVVMRKFPYSVIYHADEVELLVVSFFHHRRKPGGWQRNIAD